MTTDKRPRGRPRGSGKNDTAFLARIADLLVRDPSMRPTTAMKRVMSSSEGWQETEETLLRRLQVKWKQQGETLLMAAHERARLKSSPSLPQALAAVATVHYKLQQFAHDPQFQRAIVGLTVWQRKAAEALASPEMRAWIHGLATWERKIAEAISRPGVPTGR
jgi:hypothetical protein